MCSTGGKCQCFAPFFRISSRSFFSTREGLTEEEEKHLNQELPPREMLSNLGKESKGSANLEDDESIKIPGDSFGIMRNRVTFYRPIPVRPFSADLERVMPVSSTHRNECFNELTVRHLGARFGVSSELVVNALRMEKGNINGAVKHLEECCGPAMKFGSFGVVCLESYAPEAFCLASYNLSSFDATQDDEILDALHELTLSAAELPLDTPRDELLNRFLTDWTIESGELCRDVLEKCDVTVSRIVLLPFGDYSVQGFHVLDPVKESVPNIGTAAAACCLDLRTGIHNRFRFHVEKIADTISDHVLHEMIHYNQGVHLLRQPFWFHPSYSVEEYIRFKESLLQPSASTFEMRYAFLFSQMYNLPSYCNVVEMEKLKVAQHKYEKHYEDFTAPGKWITSDGANLQTVVAAGGGSNAPGGIMHYHSNEAHTIHTAMETRAAPLRKTLAESIQRHGDRVFSRFYRNNYF